MGIGMTSWEWEGMGTVKVIPAHLYPRSSEVCCKAPDTLARQRSSDRNLDLRTMGERSVEQVSFCQERKSR